MFWEWQDGRATRDGDWKLVAEGTEEAWELYHLANDPFETKNVAQENPEVVNQLAAEFETWKASVSFGSEK